MSAMKVFRVYLKGEKGTTAIVNAEKVDDSGETVSFLNGEERVANFSWDEVQGWHDETRSVG